MWWHMVMALVHTMDLTECVWSPHISLGQYYIRFGTKLYRQIVSITMGNNCATLEAYLFLFCYERGFMLSLSADKNAETIEAFNLTSSRYLVDLLNIDNTYFDGMVKQI